MKEKNSISLFSMSVLTTIVFITLQLGGTISYPIWLLFLPVMIAFGVSMLVIIIMFIVELFNQY